MGRFGGTYAGSCTWFEAQIRSADTAPGSEAGTASEIEIQRNINASLEWRVHTLTWERDSGDPRVSEWMHHLMPGDTIVVLAKAQYPGWANYVQAVRVDVYGDI